MIGERLDQAEIAGVHEAVRQEFLIFFRARRANLIRFAKFEGRIFPSH
jgi:hypothetical protein